MKRNEQLLFEESNNSLQMSKLFFSIKKETLTLLLLISSLFTASAQNEVTVRGIVKDKLNNPLTDVTVRVKGKNMGTFTDDRGKFSLVALPSDSLLFSTIGYNNKVISVRNNLNPTVILIANQNSLQSVVVIGYGAQKQKDLTGSVGVVQMNTIKNQIITGANQALSGQIAGVQVNTTNGIPGGGPQITIRGVGAIGAGNTPLYVVDGFPLSESSPNGSQISNPLNNIPPSDIASISVLKGPSATAIYGSRAANGVVIITTKEGANGKLKFDVDAYTGIQTIPNRQKPQMLNARQFATFMSQWIEDNNRVTGLNDTIPGMYQNPSQYGTGTDWYNAVTREAPVQSITVSANGGSNSIRSFFSVNYFRQKGVVLASDYNRISLRANVDAKISPKISIGIRISPTYSFGNNSTVGQTGRNNYYGEWEFLNPIEPIYNKDGSYNAYINGPGLLGATNPVMGLLESTNRSTQFDLLSTAFISYNLTNDVQVKSTVNAELNDMGTTTFNPSTLGGGLNSPPPSIPSGTYSQDRFLNWANENQVTYDHTFDGGSHINFLVDFSVQQELDNLAGFLGQNFPDDAIKTLNAATLITGGVNTQSWALVSYIGRLNYSYKDKYLLTGAIRRDGSSRFGPDNRWGTFPSVSAGWVISSEPWMAKSSEWLSNLKIRAGYGLTGNDQIGDYGYAPNMSISNYILNNTLAPGKTVSTIGDSKLSWEQTKELDLGLDASLLNGRVDLTADFYNSITEDLLLNINVPESSGFSSAIENIGEVRNRGFELSLRTVNINNKRFKWGSTITFSLNRNKVLALGPSGAPIIADAGWGSIYGHNITEIGKPIGMFYGYKQDGLFKDAADVAKGPSYAGAVPGALKIVDINGDGQITPQEDFTIIGNPYPKFNYSMINSLTYKNFNLNFVFTGSYGAQMFEAFYGTTHNTDGVFNVSADQLNRYRSLEQLGNGIIPTTVGAQNRLIYRSEGTWSIKNASYLWMQNMTLSYNLPQSITKKYFDNVELYLSLQNAFIITPYPFNPATSNYVAGSVLTPGQDWNPYPVPRISTIGIRLSL